MKALFLAVAFALLALPFSAQGASSPAVNNGSTWVHTGGYSVTFVVDAHHMHNSADVRTRDSSGASGMVGGVPGPGESVTSSGIMHTPGNNYRVRKGKAQVKIDGQWRDMKPRKAPDKPGGGSSGPGGHCPGPFGSDDPTTSPGLNLPPVFISR